MGVILGYYVHLYGQLPETLLLVCRTSYVLALCQALYQPTLWTNLDPLNQFGLGTTRSWAGTLSPVPLNVDISSIDMTSKGTMRIAGTRTPRSRVRNRARVTLPFSLAMECLTI